LIALFADFGGLVTGMAPGWSTHAIQISGNAANTWFETTTTEDF
jgi:hypothetical protein